MKLSRSPLIKGAYSSDVAGKRHIIPDPIRQEVMSNFVQRVRNTAANEELSGNDL